MTASEKQGGLKQRHGEESEPRWGWAHGVVGRGLGMKKTAWVKEGVKVVLEVKVHPAEQNLTRLKSLAWKPVDCVEVKALDFSALRAE